MKKICAILLAAVLLVSLTAVFAVTATTETPATADVKAQVNKTTADGVVSVDVKWDNLEFTYTDNDGKWNPTTHKFDGVVKEWSEAKNITVTNHSNIGITATAAYAKDGENDVVITLGDAVTLESAVGTEVASAPSKTISVTPSGTTANEEMTKVGTITVSISK